MSRLCAVFAPSFPHLPHFPATSSPKENPTTSYIFLPRATRTSITGFLGVLLVRSPVCSFVRAPVCSFVRSPVCSFVRSPVCPFHVESQSLSPRAAQSNSPIICNVLLFQSISCVGQSVTFPCDFPVSFTSNATNAAVHRASPSYDRPFCEVN